MSELISALRKALPASQVITDELRRLAWGTDASFYRLVPQVVAVVENEAEVLAVLEIARRFDLAPDRPQAEQPLHRNVTMIPARGGLVRVESTRA